MSTIGLIFALLLPALFGFSLLELLWRDSHWSARAGYGYLLGIFFITIILRVWDAFGLKLDFPLISTLVVGLSLVVFGLKGRLVPASTIKIPYSSFDASWQKIVSLLLISILLVRYGGILLEIIWRPLYPWDAWMNWAPKAKTWFELKELAPFVNKFDWINDSNHLGIYTLGDPRASTYPPLVPLIQTWTALGMGSWTDNLVNLPWALCLAALGLAFYGQGRMLGAKPHTTLIALFLLLSTPFLNVHTALAGYADLWLASFYAMAGMAFLNWSRTRNPIQVFLCIIFAVACTQTKVPGVIWVITLIPGALLVLLPKRLGYSFIILTIAGIITFLYVGGLSLHIPNIGEVTVIPEQIKIPGLKTMTIAYHPIWWTFVANGLNWDNWHLLGWLLLLTTPLLLHFSFRSYMNLAASIPILLGVLFLYVIFFYTKYHLEAIHNTTINRALLHLMPLLCFYMLYVVTYYKKSFGRRADIPHNTACNTQLAPPSP